MQCMHDKFHGFFPSYLNPFNISALSSSCQSFPSRTRGGVGSPAPTSQFIGSGTVEDGLRIVISAPYSAAVSVNIDATGPFQSYTNGVYYNPNCGPNVDHSVTVVGWGTEEGVGDDPVVSDYWIVKNSWGSDWGEDGYIRMAKDRNNNCLIASYAYFFPYDAY